MLNLSRSLIGISVVALFAAACGSSDDNKTSSTNPTETYSTTTPDTTNPSTSDDSKTYAERCGFTDPSALPTPTGNYCLGKTMLTWVDSNRLENFTADAADYREVVAKIWYPATAAASEPRSAYTDAQTVAWMQTGIPSIPAEAYAVINPFTKVDAPLPENQKFPLILFSPGLGDVVDFYTAIIEDLASHGFVVVAVNHPYLSGLTVFPDGRTTAGLYVEDFDQASAVLVGDLRLVLDKLQEINLSASGSRFSERLDFSRVSAFGHSIGGCAAVQLARQDERIRASIDIDGTIFGDLTGAWPKPMMFLLSESHTLDNDPTLAQAWTQLSSNKGLITVVKGAGHNDFKDLKYIGAPLAPDFPWEQIGFDSIEPSLALQITRQQSLQFFRTYLP